MRKASATFEKDGYLLGLENKKQILCFLQETHTTRGNEVSWKREWCFVLMELTVTMREGRNNFYCTVEKSIVDSNGRFIILKVLLSRELALLVNICARNRDNELVNRSLFQTIVKSNLDEIEDIIVGGDFNCPLIQLSTKEVVA